VSVFVAEREDEMVSRAEAVKDTAQVVVESTATHVGRIASIITGAVRDVVRELGDLATDAFEMREAASRATSTTNDDGF
jgi:hypothetical protein